MIGAIVGDIAGSRFEFCNLKSKEFALLLSVALGCFGVFGGTNNLDLVMAARKQIGVTVRYVPDYRKIAYPNGDVPREEGVCVDVVIRALRDARKVDLQKLVHEDMKANFEKYPKIWGLKKTDANIDHRRVPNLQCYFGRRGWSMPVSKNTAEYHPGDFVTCLVAKRLPHIMVVSDKKTKDGTPLVIHNIGAGAREEDSLLAYPITGHYRVGLKKSDIKKGKN